MHPQTPCLSPRDAVRNNHVQSVLPPCKRVLHPENSWLRESPGGQARQEKREGRGASYPLRSARTESAAGGRRGRRRGSARRPGCPAAPGVSLQGWLVRGGPLPLGCRPCASSQAPSEIALSCALPIRAPRLQAPPLPHSDHLLAGSSARSSSRWVVAAAAGWPSVSADFHKGWDAACVTQHSSPPPSPLRGKFSVLCT